MLSLIEDEDAIKNIVLQYLNKHSVEHWRFEELMKRLFEAGLHMKTPTQELVQIGDFYAEQMNKTTTDTSSEKSTKKIAEVKDSIEFLCLAPPIMRLVQRYNYDPSEQQSSTSSTLETSSNQENTSPSARFITSYIWFPNYG